LSEVPLLIEGGTAPKAPLFLRAIMANISLFEALFVLAIVSVVISLVRNRSVSVPLVVAVGICGALVSISSVSRNFNDGVHPGRGSSSADTR